MANCYKNSLRLAIDHGLVSIAFPSISTGVFGYPIENACRVALKEISDFLKKNDSIEKVVVVCFSERDLYIYNQASKELMR